MAGRFDFIPSFKAFRDYLDQAVKIASSPTFVALTLTQSVGTAPMTITSTTVVTNLNADLWDGYQFADYIDQAVKSSSTPTFAKVTIDVAAWSLVEIKKATVLKAEFGHHESFLYPFIRGYDTGGLLGLLDSAGAEKLKVTTSGQIACADGVVNHYKHGTISDADFTVDTDGLIGIDTLNDRIYFRIGAAESNSPSNPPVSYPRMKG